MTIHKFEDIIAWQKARELAFMVYQAFEPSRDFSFRDQIQRASVSIMNNIAEGFERQTPIEFRQHLYIARGSCGEVRSMLYLARDLGAISAVAHEQMEALTIETGKILTGLIKSITAKQN